MVVRLWWALSIVALSITHVSVSVANNFVRPQSSADYGYYAYCEVSHFVYCLLQKIKQSSVLPLVEKWEDYMTPNHSKFAAIEEDRFLAGTRVLSALEKVGSSYLKKEFRRDCRKFLEDFVNCVLSTVAARSAIGQGLSCFCPPILIGGDDHAPLQLFDLLLDGLLAKGWVRGGDMEACKSEYQSFVQEQRQLERTSTRSRPDVGNVLTFCSSKAGFRVRSHLYKACIGFNKAGFNLAAFWFILVSFQVFQLAALALRGPLPSGEKFTVKLDRVAIREDQVRCVLLCVQEFVRDPVFTQRSFFSETGVEMLSEAAAISDSITSSSVYVPWSSVESESSARIISDVKTCFNKALERRRLVKDASEQWYRLGAVRPSSGESSSQYGVRISTVVEEGKVDYVPVAAPSRKVTGQSRRVTSPGKGKKKVSDSPVKVRRQFEVSSPPVSSRKRTVIDDPNFAAALTTESLRGKTRKSGRDRKAAPIFQGGMP